MKFNKDKSKVLPLGCKGPWTIVEVEDWWLGRWCGEKALGVLGRSEVNISQQRALRGKMASSILGCVTGGTTSKPKEVINPLYSALIRLHLDTASSLGPIIQGRHKKTGKFSKRLPRWYEHWSLCPRMEPKRFRLVMRRKEMSYSLHLCIFWGFQDLSGQSPEHSSLTSQVALLGAGGWTQTPWDPNLNYPMILIWTSKEIIISGKRLFFLF